MKDNNYITVQGWMVNRLKLSGNELFAYAAIWGFSQDGKSIFMGSGQYLADTIGVSRRSVVSILGKLIEKGFIKKYARTQNGVRRFGYRAVYPCEETSHESEDPCEETSQESEKNLLKKREESSHNIINNISNNIRVGDSDESPPLPDSPPPLPASETKKEKPGKKENHPDLQEVEAYFKSAGLDVSASDFYAYFTDTVVKSGQKPWTDSSGRKVKNWRLKAQTWNRFNAGKGRNGGGNSDDEHGGRYGKPMAPGGGGDESY